MQHLFFLLFLPLSCPLLIRPSGFFRKRSFSFKLPNYSNGILSNPRPALLCTRDGMIARFPIQNARPFRQPSRYGRRQGRTTIAGAYIRGYSAKSDDCLKYEAKDGSPAQLSLTLTYAKCGANRVRER